MDGYPEVNVEILGEAAHLLRLRALGAAETQREANHDFSNLIVVEQTPQSLQIAAFVLPLEGGKPLGGNAQGVGDGDPNPPRADIEGKSTAGGGGSGFGHRMMIDCWSGCVNEKSEVRSQNAEVRPTPKTGNSHNRCSRDLGVHFCNLTSVIGVLLPHSNF